MKARPVFAASEAERMVARTGTREIEGTVHHISLVVYCVDEKVHVVQRPSYQFEDKFVFTYNPCDCAVNIELPPKVARWVQRVIDGEEQISSLTHVGTLDQFQSAHAGR